VSTKPSSSSRPTAASTNACTREIPRNGASEVTLLASDIRARAVEAAAELEKRLAGVLYPAGPECPAKAVSQNSIAPLFSDLRSTLQDTWSALDAIGNIISRLDV
jgi:hypothetical protein